MLDMACNVQVRACVCVCVCESTVMFTGAIMVLAAGACTIILHMSQHTG